MTAPLPPPGWYPNPSGRGGQRYWDGSAWAPDPALGLQPVQPLSTFDQELMAIAARGGRIEARTPTSAVVVTGKPVNHVLHLLITVLLCGLWLPVWIILAIGDGERRTFVSLDQYGTVRHANRAPPPPNANWLGRMSENQATLVVIAILIGGVALIAFVAQLLHS
ncbi:hypothetical protein DAVIS_01856 [Mycobacterium marinum]|uniref:DUF2510 domain-containing protein n=1 Tax=Mycobacterium marinum TaxID=1781 RepID=A0A3E2MYD5_MYCMR|nr:DUF2510 domain-containing protein [Mycobacterium marinum]RFZ43904.1 hypothetical protein DAVIS_01856 [Mycobacterium marinum]